MALSAKSRSWVLGLVLAATLVAAFAPTESAESDNPEHASVAALASPAATPLPASRDATLIVISRPLAAEPGSDPFSTSSWLPPPPPPAPPPPPTPPAPPSLPYTYLGRLDDAGKTSVLLGQADNSYGVRVGDTVDSVWRIERVTDQAIDFTYLPLAARKTLVIGNNP